LLIPLFFSAYFFLYGNLSTHDIHISKCQVEYSAEDKALQVTLHIYLDDLQDALRKKGADKLFLCTEKENPNADQHLVAYLKDHLKLTVNNRLADFVFIGKEPSEDLLAAWCYLEIPEVTHLKNLTIENDILMDLYDDQQNIISVLAPNKQQGYFLFQKGKSVETMQF
jgi:hypothetical protein